MTYTSPKPAWEAKNAVFWQDTPNLHILKKNQHVDAKSAQHLHILKKIKSFDSEKSPNLHILKKIKNLRLYVGLTGIDELVFDFFDFSEYMQVWWLFTIKTFDFFEYMQVLCAFGIKMLIFFEYMQDLSFSLSKCLFFLSICRFEGLEVHQTCMYSKKINVLGLFPINMFVFWVYVGLKDLRFTKPAYTQKKSTCWCQKCTKPAYTQKNQKFW